MGVPVQGLPARPWVIAHRGASRDRPENTLAAFDEALAQRADAFELDVQLSRDGLPVVYHDRTLAKAGLGRRRVGELDARALGAHVPLLADVLARYAPRVQLLVELKAREHPARNEELACTVAQLVERMGLLHRVLLLSFDERVLAAARRALPELRCVLNLKPPPLMTPAIRRRLEALHALSTDVRTLTLPFAASLRRAGRPLFVYTCNTPRAVARARAAGALGVMSDRPAWLRDRLEARADEA